MGTTTGNRHLFITVGTYGGTILKQLVPEIKAVQKTFPDSFNPVFYAIDTNSRIKEEVKDPDLGITPFHLNPLATKGQGSGTDPKVAMNAWHTKKDEFFQLVGDLDTVESATVIAPPGKGGGTASGCTVSVCMDLSERGVATAPILLTPAVDVKEACHEYIGTCQHGYNRNIINQLETYGVPFFQASSNWSYEQARLNNKIKVREADKMVIDQFKDAILRNLLFWVWGTMIDPADMRGRVLKRRPGAAPRLKSADVAVKLGSDNPKEVMLEAVTAIHSHNLFYSQKSVEVAVPFLQGEWNIGELDALYFAMREVFGSEIQFCKTAFVPDFQNKEGQPNPSEGRLGFLLTTVTQLASIEEEYVPEYQEEPSVAEIEVSTGDGVSKIPAGQFEKAYTYRYGSLLELIVAARHGKREEAREANHILFYGDPFKLRDNKLIASREDRGRLRQLLDFDMEQSKIGPLLIKFGEGSESYRLPILESLLSLLDARYEEDGLSPAWESFLFGAVEEALFKQGEALPRYMVKEWNSLILFNSRDMTPDRLRKDSRWQNQWEKWRNTGDSRARLLLLKVVLEILFGEEEVSKLPHEPEETRSVFERGKEALGMWVERRGWGRVKRLARSLKPAKTKTSPVVSMEIREPTKQVNGHPPVPVAVEEFAKTQVSSPLQ